MGDPLLVGGLGPGAPGPLQNPALLCITLAYHTAYRLLLYRPQVLCYILFNKISKNIFTIKMTAKL